MEGSTCPHLFGLVVARRREKTGKQDTEDDTNQILGNKKRWKGRRRTTAGWMGGPAHVASVCRSSRRPVPPIRRRTSQTRKQGPQIVGSCMYTPPLSFSGLELGLTALLVPGQWLHFGAWLDTITTMCLCCVLGRYRSAYVVETIG